MLDTRPATYGSLPWHLPLLLGAAAAALVVVINGSPRLPALHGDSMAYLGAAESLVAGRGLEIPVASWQLGSATSPLNHFPPGFSVVLAGLMLLGFTSVDAALAVMALSAGATVALAGRLAALATPGRTGAMGAVSAGAILLFSVPVVQLHTAVWSEPLFLALFLGTGLAMVRAPDRPLVYGLTAAAAMMVRYVGVSVGMAVIVWAWRKEGRRAAVVAGVPSLAAGAAWAVSLAAAGGPTRRPGLDSTVFRDLGAVAGEFGPWLAPGLEGGLAGTVVVAVLAAGVWVAVRPAPRRPTVDSAEPEATGERRAALRPVMGLLAASYIAVLIPARILLDPLVPLDSRLLSPLIVVLAVLVAIGLAGRWPTWGVAGRCAVGAVLVAWTGLSVAEIVPGVRAVQEYGRYYTSVRWDGVPAIRWAEAAPRDLPLYSNEPELILLRTGRTAYRVPVVNRAGSLAAFEAAFQRSPGAVILLPPLRRGEPRVATLIRRLGLKPVVARDDGAVLAPAVPVGSAADPPGP